MVSIKPRAVITNIAIGISVLLALLVLLVSTIWMFQERIAFQPPRAPWPAENDAPRVVYTSEDGQHLFAYVVGPRVPGRGLLLAFHGNADLAIRQMEWANEVVRRTGVTVMLAEYRGYMGLSGRPTYRGSQLDAEAAYAFIRDTLRVPDERVALFGHSLGTAIATELADRHPPAVLLLQSPFTSARDMAGVMTGWVPHSAIWRLVSRLHFDTGVKVSRMPSPVSVSHGGQDALIPVAMGKAVFEAAREKGEWLLVPDAGHNDVVEAGGEAYWQWLSNSLERLPRP